MALTEEGPRGAEAFARDRVTALADGAIAVYAYYLYALGPVLALLRDELHLSYTQVSLHPSVWAAATAATGLAFGRLVRRAGRRRLFWASAAVTAAGAAAFAAAGRLWLTLTSTAVLAVGGTMMLTAASAVLADRHGRWRDRALVEANIGASAAAVTAPVVLGLLAASPAGWRPTLLLPAAALGALYLAFRRLPLPAPGPVAAPARGAGPPAGFWPLAWLVAAVVGVEFCVLFYGPQSLQASAGMGSGAAAAAMGVFYAGELAGRVAGAGLTRRPGRAGPLVLGALAVTLAAFLAFWSSGRPVPAVASLAVLGFGVANLYPLTFALAIAAAAPRTDEAAGRIQLLVGVAILVAPLTLGVLADRVGVARALTVEPLLIAAALALLALGSGRVPGRPLRGARR